MDKEKLLVATTNRGKVAEIAEWLADLPYEIVCLNDLLAAPPAVEETGETFAANAELKARAYHKHTGWLTLSDDSGLVVDALDGRPGVHSARYAGVAAPSAALVTKLLNEMQNVPDTQRTARFVCVITLFGTGVNESFTGLCEGTIAHAARGTNGFGFDPIFLDPASGRTFAELSRAEKAAISHRGRALAQARSCLQTMVNAKRGAR
jgi:XTP/dITP diphosphohydrolase